jgi:hypothetical protein
VTSLLIVKAINKTKPNNTDLLKCASDFMH